VTDGATVIIGGTSGIGLELARECVQLGREVVISGRSAERAEQIAAALGGGARGVGVDLYETDRIGARLATVGPVRHLVVTAIERDSNQIADYDQKAAQQLVTLKLVGYPEVVHQLAPRMVPDASIVLFGGLAKERPYPGSTTVSTVNGGVSGLVRTLVCELAPIRVNALHPGIVGDSPYWEGKDLDAVVARTPIGRLVKMREVAHATLFLLECGAMNGVDLFVDGGWMVK
jgi:NAD(P)-dependent dehydrogenase (short-subunit alcohol dehydrogenase family)